MQPVSIKNRPLWIRWRFALAGISHAFATEKSFRTQCAALALVMLALAILHAGALWWALVIVISALVLALELVNTAIERLTDHLHPDLHPAIAHVKDCMAGAVLIASLGALAIAVVFWIARQTP